MKKSTIYQIRNIAYIFLIFFVSSCANIVPPTGGEKDEKAPRLISTFPAHRQTEYRARIIELVFDENIAVQNLQRELLISPYTRVSFKNRVQRNRLILEFDQDLRANTTYTLNFGKAIKDLTEGNEAQNISLTFSTGTDIDTLSVKGTAGYILKGSSAENILVSLYDAEDTMQVKKHKPLYIARTDKAGNYTINNVREGTYKIFAINDRNNNLFYDNVNEEVGFLNEPITVRGNNLTGIKLDMHHYDERPYRVLNQRSGNGNINIEFNRPFDTLQVSNQQNIDIPFTTNREKNSFTIFNVQNLQDSIQINVAVQDSSGNNFTVQPKVKFTELQKREGYRVQTSPQPNATYVIALPLTIIAPEPIQQVNSRGIRIYNQRAQEMQGIEYSQLNKTTLALRNIQTNTDSIVVVIDSAAIRTVTGRLNSSDTLVYTRGTEANKGDLGGTVQIAQGQDFIVELLNPQFEVLQRRYNTRQFKFTNLEPGKYRLRLIVDQNKNKKWDKGSFEKAILPERVILIPQETELRANWDINDLVFVVD